MGEKIPLGLYACGINFPVLPDAGLSWLSVAYKAYSVMQGIHQRKDRQKNYSYGPAGRALPENVTT